jgi:prepilin-type N-terminal cleavage/methylation domain-containing protein
VTRAQGERGFTLLEVLVALVLLATVAVAVLQVFGGGARLLRASGDHLGATILAGAKLDEIGAGPLQEGVTEGTEGSYRWTQRVSLDEAPPAGDPVSPETGRVRLARVTVAVEWGRSRRLELATLRSWGTRP